MSDIANYGIAIEIKNGLSALKTFKQAATSFDKGRMAALVAQKNMLEQMKKLHDSMYTKPIKPPSSPTQPTRPTRPTTPDSTFVGPQIDKNTQNFLKRQAKERLAAEQRTTKEKNKQSRADAARLSALKKARERVMDLALMTEKEASAAQRATQGRIKSKIALATSAKQVKDILRDERASLRLAKKKSFLVSRMEASSKEFAGNMVSAFAVAAGGVYVTQTGQNLEAVRNTMLTVSEDAQAAGENLEFVKEQSMRLGVGFKESAKQYAKMVAAQGEMSDDDLRNSFLGLAEMSTVLGLSADESGRAFTALTQIMSKGQVMAEELKGQLGEVMPNALQVMAKAAKDAGLETDGSVKALMKLMENGEVMAKDVMPHFARRMRETAAVGLDKAMDSNRVAMNRMLNTMQIAADNVFINGWAEGLTELFNTVAEVIKENDVLFTEFGKTMGKVFKGFAWIVEKLVAPALGALGSILKGLNDAMDTFGNWVAAAIIPMAKFSPLLGGIITKLGGFRAVLAPIAAMAVRVVAPFVLLLGVLEEVAEFFSPTEGKQTLLGFNINDVKSAFAPWVEDLQKVVDLYKEIRGFMGKDDPELPETSEVPVKTTPFSNTLIRMLTPSFGNFAPDLVPKSSKVDNNIEVNTYIGGEKLGEVIANSPTVRESVNRQINSSFQYNYN
ncbi:hypothetical protein VPBG_00053 [Vibrio phage helene 12B3]|uniref:tail length tape measure protein n=1 Tax=Vibrio phage helene 12B3 TaxID=573173 RepID=UPI0002C0C05C|nr:tail length tape measure protein [Vibrio phage helene 12B3]AGG57825.1 hypothetical protein VPBG_00053 [Vibrio phage helene 12B3]